MRILFLLALATILTTFSCSRERYLTPAYQELADRHQVIAVLPSHTITTGRIPPEWTPEMLQTIEENESHAFQIAVFDEIAERSGIRDGSIGVNLQHYTETNAKLEAAGIDVRQSWKLSPTELSDILGVDAVVRTSVRKDMFLTDLESFSISLAQTAIAIFGGPFFGVPNRTSNVFLSASVLDAEQGVTVWNTDRRVETDWNNNHAEIVRRLARIMARRFPYRM